ncbi:pyridoxal phosphate-dependent aminotransferase [Dongia deserti]|uniref:pyridoxal phosphate-dependent aminotransferase n=1 Tax=Dongia deserti TaxID=2268030 RepID=UPI000E64EA2C|nr:pyridoxal phosphate-dependent aminotransferase [Dongia deserti]
MNLNIRPDIASLEESQIVEVWRMGFDIPDVIGMWVGQGDLPTPRFICDAASRALAAGDTFYTHKRGIPALRQALIDYHRDLYGVEIADSRIAITSSGMNAMVLIVQTLVSAGDNVVCVTPVWPNIFAAIQIQGGIARHVPMAGTDHGWELDLDRVFAACDDRTRAIYLASPGNPTGWVMPEEQRRAVLDFARQRGIALIADEVYNRLIYDRRVAPSFLEIAQPDDPLFVVNSFSKTWAMTGWRIGWMIMPQGLTDQVDRLIEFNTSGGQSFLQAGCIAAIREGEPWVEWMVERCKRGRDLVVARLNAMNRVSVIPANASYYLMLRVEEMGDPVAFCKRLVREARIGLAPGTAFGAGGEHYLRLCYAQGEERLGEAMDRLQAFLGKA